MKPIHKNVVRLGSTLLLALSATLTARADYQSTVLSQNPSGFYRLDGTLSPQPNGGATNSGSLGAAANGTFVALPTLNAPGPFSGSVSIGLDGTSQYINTPVTAGLNTATFTYEIWVNPATIPKFAYMSSSAQLNSPRSGWYFAQDDGSTFALGSAWVFRTFNQNAANPLFTVAAPVTPGWTYLAVTFDGTSLKIYTNGVFCQSTNDASGIHLCADYGCAVHSWHPQFA
ncbi:MAG: LamG-like jellyroll fold domain-containing protein [Limisphaerales bacterium]